MVSKGKQYAMKVESAFSDLSMRIRKNLNDQKPKKKKGILKFGPEKIGFN